MFTFLLDCIYIENFAIVIFQFLLPLSHKSLKKESNKQVENKDIVTEGEKK